MRVLQAGLIGEHISRTRLPRALQIMCDLVGLELDFELIDTALLDEFEFTKCVDILRQKGWSGVTVTHPFKTEAADYAGAGMIAEVAPLGASNTLVFGDQVSGFNTDFTGFLAAFEAVTDRGPVVMAGAGGVARSLGAALVREGISDLAIYDVDNARATDLAYSIGPPARAIPIKDAAEAVRSAAGLVNATPLGMIEYPGSAFDVDLSGPQVWAFDAVYTPTDTVFLKASGAAGLQTISGFELFKHMVIRSFEAYTSIPVDPDVVLPKLEELRP
jgi:shikimate dehydrogenase